MATYIDNTSGSGVSATTRWSVSNQGTTINSGRSMAGYWLFEIPSSIHDVTSAVLTWNYNKSGSSCSTSTDVYTTNAHVSWGSKSIDVIDDIVPGEKLKVNYYYSFTGNLMTINGSYSSTSSMSNVVLTIEYTPYTPCKAPTTLTLAKTSAAPGESVSLSWSGAQAGSCMQIGSYNVYRSTDDKTYSVLSSGITGTSLNVVSPIENGSAYYYKVKTVGSVSGYDSVLSSAVELSCDYTAPTINSVTIDNGSSDLYVKPGTSATLKWTSSNGTNNPIQSYTILRNGQQYKTGIKTKSLSVSSPSSAGSGYYFTVCAVGSYLSSESKTSPTIFSYSDPTPPSTVTVNPSSVGPSSSSTLSWSGAKSGSYNPIGSYKVYRSTSASGTYSLLQTTTSSSITATSPSSSGSSYYYKIQAVGSLSVSEKSDYTVLTSTSTKPKVSGLKIDNVSSVYAEPGSSHTLTWSSQNGQNNLIVSYTIYKNGSSFKTGVSSRSYSITAGQAGAGDSYSVVAVGTYSNSTESSSVSLYAYGTPEKVQNLALSKSSADAGQNVSLSWNSVQNAPYNAITGYTVYIASSSTGDYSFLGQTSSTSYTVTANKNMGSTDYYKVCANGTRSSGQTSDAVSLYTTVYEVPTAPTSVQVDNVSPDAGTNVTLSWSGASGGTNNPITGYVVYYDDGNGLQLAKQVSTSQSSGSVSVGTPGTMNTQRTFYVKTVGQKSGFADSSLSAGVTIVTTNYSQCGSPTVSISKQIENPGNTIQISWTQAASGINNPVAGYKVLRSIGEQYSVFSTVQSTVYSVDDTVLSSGTTMSYKVIAVGTKSGLDSADSNIVSCVSNTPPSSVSFINQDTTVYESGGVRLEWTQSSDVDNNFRGYQIQRRIQTVNGSLVFWGSWLPVVTILGTSTTYTDKPNVPRGLRFMYRVAAFDELNLFSQYADSVQYIRNTAPVAPTVVYPPTGSETYNKRPYVIINVPQDANKHKLSIMVNVDNTGYKKYLNTYVGRSIFRIDHDLLYDNNHAVVIKAVDELGAQSEQVTVVVRPVQAKWQRTIARGTIISKPGSYYEPTTGELIDEKASYDGDTLVASSARYDNDNLIIQGQGISHQAEVKQLFSMANVIARYFGMSEMTIPQLVGNNYANAGTGKIGMFAAWGDQMKMIVQLLNGAADICGIERPDCESITTGMIPDSTVINVIRETIENV